MQCLVFHDGFSLIFHWLLIMGLDPHIHVDHMEMAHLIASSDASEVIMQPELSCIANATG